MAGDALSVIETGLQGVETAMQAVSNNLANAQIPVTNRNRWSRDPARRIRRRQRARRRRDCQWHHPRPLAGRHQPDQLAYRHGDPGQWIFRAERLFGRTQLRPQWPNPGQRQRHPGRLRRRIGDGLFHQRGRRLLGNAGADHHTARGAGADRFDQEPSPATSTRPARLLPARSIPPIPRPIPRR